MAFVLVYLGMKALKAIHVRIEKTNQSRVRARHEHPAHVRDIPGVFRLRDMGRNYPAVTLRRAPYILGPRRPKMLGGSSGFFPALCFGSSHGTATGTGALHYRIRIGLAAPR